MGTRGDGVAEFVRDLGGQALARLRHVFLPWLDVLDHHPVPSSYYESITNASIFILFSGD
ncbi:hypothetical protein GCM10009839_34340 [Catenulispora yoronensis]|uniref:Uncharacterized protein n=1 Tax=Catenulispora yoronensis TaxID=450799 RepID=A0ABN2U8Y6_9ACTN